MKTAVDYPDIINPKKTPIKDFLVGVIIFTVDGNSIEHVVSNKISWITL